MNINTLVYNIVLVLLLAYLILQINAKIKRQEQWAVKLAVISMVINKQIKDSVGLF